jgi:hypothetical protein
MSWDFDAAPDHESASSDEESPDEEEEEESEIVKDIEGKYEHIIF